jgi:mercuric ion transport protein
MNNPERLPSETHKPITGYLWGGLAVLTCPCHLPILAVVLAGTTAGAFLGEHWVIAALGLRPLSVRPIREFEILVDGCHLRMLRHRCSSSPSRSKATRRRACFPKHDCLDGSASRPTTVALAC